MAATKSAQPAQSPYQTQRPAGPPLDYCFMDVTDLKSQR